MVTELVKIMKHEWIQLGDAIEEDFRAAGRKLAKRDPSNMLEIKPRGY